MAEQCPYCGRFMALVDYGAEYGEELVCSRQFDHIVADPEHWLIGSLDMAVRVAKARAGLDPDQLYAPAKFIDHLDEKWRRPFWERQVDRAVESMRHATADRESAYCECWGGVGPDLCPLHRPTEMEETR